MKVISYKKVFIITFCIIFGQHLIHLNNVFFSYLQSILRTDELFQLSVLSPIEIIKKYNYPVEVHQVTTEDGYILELHRIPHGKNSNASTKAPVLILPGAIATSFVWVYDEQCIAYELANNGYDVWLANTRGNTYSKGHKYLPTNSNQYWNFTWHEMGLYDLPAMIDYILLKTGYESLNYIGHSQGTTISYVTLSKKPEYNDKIRVMAHMAPSAYLGGANNFFKLLSLPQFLKLYEMLFSMMGGEYDMMENPGLYQAVPVQWLCKGVVPSMLCMAPLMFTNGPNFYNINTNKTPAIMSHFPAGASSKTIRHYFQLVATGEFAEFMDFSKHPMDESKHYNISAITAPVAFYYSMNDWICDVEDVENLAKKLPNVVVQHLVSDPNYNHLDYILGVNTPQVLNPHVIDTLNKYN